MRTRLAATLAAAVAMVAACSLNSPTGTSSPSSVAQEQQAAYVGVIKDATPSVVEIETGEGLGSGVVMDDQGNIITNSHVVGAARDVMVVASDGKRYPGTVVGAFPPDDLAVVRIGAHGLRVATFADSARVQVGQVVVAIGNPLGLQSSVTNGIVSATGRVVTADPNTTLPDAIQTSAAINPGNSGGALVDMQARVIGIPTLAALTPGAAGGAAQAPGIGFAISSNRAKDIGGQIAKNGRVTDSHRAYLGISSANITEGRGVAVARVEPGGPADDAGIAEGDVILSVDGKPVTSTSDLSQVLAGLQVGQTVQVVVMRPDGSRRTVQVKLGQYPGS